MPTIDPCFTPFDVPIEGYDLPALFTYPFCYQPHPLCQLAAEQLQQHLISQTHWQHNFGLVGQDSNTAIGKMFGVLVVRDQRGQIGYLSAFSGKLAEQNHLPHFVPPVFDMLSDDGFFLASSKPINAINQKIEQLESSPQRQQLQQQLITQQQITAQQIEQLRQTIISARQQRKSQRQQIDQQFAQGKISAEQQQQHYQQLAQQSVAEKAQQKQLKQDCQQQLDQVEQQIALLNQKIGALKHHRKQLSNQLQQKLFAQYQFLNQYQHSRSLLDIFQAHTNPVPPAGSGECAAPKLLHYAFAHHMTPLAMAEFWWGSSPKSEIRQHKKFYPACQNKCQPILAHMLEGIALEPNPLLDNPAQDKDFDIIYQDEAMLVINKPAEFLSVPGVHIQDSVYHRLQQQFLDVEGPFVIHRLDMSTSGLLVFALTKRANKSLQKQFISRSVHKRYVALIEGELNQSEGEIDLPLRGDPNDRPRQLVCFEHGKPAHTEWQLIEQKNGRSKVYLYPKTGRTHQLRMHCAHPQGLNIPIVGDDLYGETADRLHLHAESLSFDHPYTKHRMEFKLPVPF